MIERLCLDACCAVFAFLSPAAAATVRGCSRTLYEHPNWKVTSRLWIAAVAHSQLINVFAHLEGIAAMQLFDAIYALPEAELAAGAQLILRVACGRGWLKKARWATKQFRIQRAPPIWAAPTGAFHLACSGGHLSVAQWMVTAFAITASELSHNAAWRNLAFRAACEAGHLDMAKWLERTFEVNIELLEALPAACAGGHLLMVYWLVAIGRLRAHCHARSAHIVAAFKNACNGGHLLIAQHLATTFAIDTYDVQELLGAACKTGHLAVAEWLADRYYTIRYTLSFEQRSRRVSLFQTACSAGQLEMAQWTVAKFGLSNIDARSESGRALRSACTHGHLAVAQWLVAQFDLDPADAVIYAPHPRVVAWLSDFKK